MRHTNNYILMASIFALSTFMFSNIGHVAEELNNSSEATEPFLYANGPVTRLDESHRRGRLYRKAIAKFPDTRSCLKDNAASNGDRSELPIDWTKLGEREERDVCIFRIGSSIKSVAVFRDWLMRQEYRITDLHLSGTRAVNFKNKSELIDVCLFSADLPIDVFSERVDVGILQSTIWKIWGVERIYIDFNMTCDGRMISVGEIVNYL